MSKLKNIPSNLSFVGVVWYDHLGVVKCLDTITNEIKIFVGMGMGFDEDKDIEKIINLGTKYLAADFRYLVEWLTK